MLKLFRQRSITSTSSGAWRLSLPALPGWACGDGFSIRRRSETQAKCFEKLVAFVVGSRQDDASFTLTASDMPETRENYLKDFQDSTGAPGAPLDDSAAKVRDQRQRQALKQALDIRKFEIELYWKRAVYFWTFIAAAFAGYFALQKDGEFASVYVTTCLGFLFSLAWYLVNRGSASWQQNWEKHVDLLEDEIMGPLYKSHIDRKAEGICELLEPYPFSPSRLNNILALSITFVWLVLITRTLWKWKVGILNPPHSSPTAVILSIFTIVVAISLVWKGQAKRPSKSKRTFERHKREYS